MKQIIIIENNIEIKNWFNRSFKNSYPFASITYLNNIEDIKKLKYDDSAVFFVNESFKIGIQLETRFLIIHHYNPEEKNCTFTLYVRRPFENLIDIYDEIHMHKDVSDTIILTDQKEPSRISIKEIIYIERIKRYSLIKTANHVYSTKLTFNDLLPQLPDNFAQTHRSFIVNFFAVREFIRTDFILETNDFIPISRSYSKIVEEKWNHFFKIYIKNSL